MSAPPLSTDGVIELVVRDRGIFAGKSRVSAGAGVEELWSAIGGFIDLFTPQRSPPLQDTIQTDRIPLAGG